MTSIEQKRTVVLAATDGSSVSDDVLRTSASVAENAPQGELHIVYVLEPKADPAGRNALLLPLTELLSNARTVLEKAAARASATFSGRIATHLLVGDPWREILQLSTNLGADLIVVGSHGRTGLDRFFLGSVSEQVVRKACCQVLVARPKDYGKEAIPEIEPACPACLATQHATTGEKLWCERHERKQQHAHGRLHYELPQTFGVGSMLLRPES